MRTTGRRIHVRCRPTRFSVSEEELRLLQEVAANLSFALQYLEKQDAVRFLSYFDPLTGLAKRSLFCERLEPAAAARRDAEADRPTVVVFDIEHMSAINDAFGRHVGDLLLQRVADRAEAAASTTPSISRIWWRHVRAVVHGGRDGTNAPGACTSASLQLSERRSPIEGARFRSP